MLALLSIVICGAACGDNGAAPGRCSDGEVQAPEECDDGNSDDGDTCRNDCTVPRCGDGLMDAGEECDDGNTQEGDACHGNCQLDTCGDGLIQLDEGETCDDRGRVDGDGCDAACHFEPFQTVAPVKLSGERSCTTSVANAARKVSVDGSGTIYAVMTCSSTAYVAISRDRGRTYSSLLDLSTALGTPGAPAVVSQVAVANGPSGTAYVAMMLNNGAVRLRTTGDSGATWAAAVPVGTAISPTAGLSLQAFNDDVYIGFTTDGGVAVARNGARGSGGFTTTAVGMSIAFFDLIYDVALGTLAVCTDTPAFHVRISDDGGATFGAEVNPPGQQFFSDWALGAGTIFVVGNHLSGQGSSTSVHGIPSGAPTTSTQVFGLPLVTSAQTRSVAADAAGNVFVASQLDGGGVQLDRLATGATAFAAPRTISATGGWPGVSALPDGSGAAVVYTIGGEVWATIQSY